jgi:ABC-2 type transport system ATP-binding protein
MAVIQTVPAVVDAATDRAAVVVRDLVKRYRKRPVNAVDGVSFAVAPGEVFGLLGPNGAGKTTTVGILTTRVRKTSGDAVVAGVDVAADPVGARGRLAVVPQRPNLDRSLSIRQNLLFHAAYHGVERTERAARADVLLGQFGLADRAGEVVDTFSGGQVQRIMIARALMHAPQVLFLDEPTTGLDPQARLFVWDRVRDLRDAGITTVLTTQNMEEAEALADRVGIMDHGRLLALDTPDALTATLPGSAMLEITVEGEIDHDGLLQALGGLAGVERVEQVGSAPRGGPPGGVPPGVFGGGGPPTGPPPGAGGPPPARAAGGRRGPLVARLYLTGQAAELIAPVNDLLGARGARLAGVQLAQPSLEDVFIELTGRALR